MSRLGLVLSYVGLLVGFYILGYIFGYVGHEYNEGTYTIMATAGVVTILALRLQNIGKPAWYSFGSLVPILGIYIVGMCLVLPDNYEVDKQLDLPAKIILSIYGVLVVIGIAAAIILPMING